MSKHSSCLLLISVLWATYGCGGTPIPGGKSQDPSSSKQISPEQSVSRAKVLLEKTKALRTAWQKVKVDGSFMTSEKLFDNVVTDWEIGNGPLNTWEKNAKNNWIIKTSPLPNTDLLKQAFSATDKFAAPDNIPTAANIEAQVKSIGPREEVLQAIDEIEKINSGDNAQTPGSAKKIYQITQAQSVALKQFLDTLKTFLQETS